MAGARLDRWEDSDGHLRTVSSGTGALILQSLYPNRTGTEFSPSAGMAWDPTTDLHLHVAAQHAFRQPTLNELYRPFRQGNATTLSNAGLSTEHAETAEVGADWRQGPLRIWPDRVRRAPGQPRRQRDARAGTRDVSSFRHASRGVRRAGAPQLWAARTPAGCSSRPNGRRCESLSLNLSAIDETATVASAPVSPGLVGKALPEVPRWSASLGLVWHPLRRFYVSLRARSSALQYDDDLNQLPLASYSTVDASLRLVFSVNAEVFASLENASNSRVETAHSALGVYNIAPPRMAGAGARLSW